MGKYKNANSDSLLFGLPLDKKAKGFRLSELSAINLTQIAWRNSEAPGKIAQICGVEFCPESMADGAARNDDGSLLPIMPGRALYFSNVGLRESQLKSLRELGCYTLDLSAGRTVLTLRGPHCAWTLMKGSGIDFERMRPGSTAQTNLFKISTMVWMINDNETRLIVSYAFSRGLAERLLDAGQEHGLRFVG